MDDSIHAYNQKQTEYQTLCETLAAIIQTNLINATSKVWHAHPVWFIDDNPIVGYSVQKPGVRLMFWSGRSFDEPELVGSSRFQDASIFYTKIDQIEEEKIKQWLKKAETIQWDYKNIVKHKGVLERLK